MGGIPRSLLPRALVLRNNPHLRRCRSLVACVSKPPVMPSSRAHTRATMFVAAILFALLVVTLSVTTVVGALLVHPTTPLTSEQRHRVQSRTDVAEPAPEYALVHSFELRQAAFNGTNSTTNTTTTGGTSTTGGSDDRDLVMEQGLIFGGGGLAVVLCAGLALALIICVCLIRMFVPQCNSLDCCLSWRVMSPVAFASFVTLCCLAVMCVLLMAFAVVGFLIAPDYNKNDCDPNDKDNDKFGGCSNDWWIWRLFVWVMAPGCLVLVVVFCISLLPQALLIWKCDGLQREITEAEEGCLHCEQDWCCPCCSCCGA